MRVTGSLAGYSIKEEVLMSEKLWDGFNSGMDFWDFVVLQPLSDGEPTCLKSIYAAIHEEGKLVGVKERLFKVDGRYGDRPDYTHVVRFTMSSLKNRRMVEHLEPDRSGMYRITDKGRERLKELEP